MSNLKNKLLPTLFTYLIGALTCVMLCVQGAQAQLRIEVELLKPKPIADKNIYLVADFNDWDPGDIRYTLKQQDNTHYFIDIDAPPKYFQFKFTQGSWMTVEGTPAGESIPNRIYDAQLDGASTVKATILGWEKLITYDIYVTNVPENTPKDAKIYISGNFNNWDAGSPAYQLHKLSNGEYKISINSELPKIEYKFTRGSWESVEGRQSGKSRQNRILFRDSALDNKSIRINIEGWEDLMGTPHIYSLLDLLLLFSVFQSILLIFAIPIIQSSNVQANRWLILSLAVSALAIFFYLISNFKSFVNASPRIVLFSDFVYFLYGPIFYLYLKRLLFNVPSLSSKWYLHFVPFVIHFFVYLPFLLQNDKTFLLDLMNQKPLIINIFGGAGILAWFWNLYYWNLYRKALNSYQNAIRINQSYDQNLNLLRIVVVIHLLVLCFWAFSLVIIIINNYFHADLLMIFENSIDLTWLIFSLIPYFIGYFAIHQSETFKANPSQLSIFEDLLETTTPAQLVEATPEKISENYAQEIKNLEAHLKQNKPYTNAKITLNELAEQINVAPHLLSKIINEHYDQNFFDFINSYRVEEFKLLVQDTKYRHLTFLSLAFEVGFNSKTAFNRAFKKLTNLTPKEYFDSIKKGVTL